jgi:MarR family transcriptional regulator for hemolysin
MQYIFGSLLTIANRMDTLLERDLKEFGVTSKQWFLSVIIDNLFDNPPTMKEVAKEMGSSHQNIKQVALKLQEKDLLKIEKDEKDARVSRLKMTEQSHEFWKKTQPKGNIFIESVFKDIEKEELKKTADVLQKILFNLTKIEN